jgi:site-specific DNA recombinase
MELRVRLSSIKLQLDVLDRSHDEMADLAAKVFELSQTLSRNGLRQITPQSAESWKLCF